MTTRGQPKIWAEENNSDSSQKTFSHPNSRVAVDVSPAMQKQSSNRSSVSEIKRSPKRSLSMKCLFYDNLTHVVMQKSGIKPLKVVNSQLETTVTIAAAGQTWTFPFPPLSSLVASMHLNARCSKKKKKTQELARSLQLHGHVARCVLTCSKLDFPSKLSRNIWFWPVSIFGISRRCVQTWSVSLMLPPRNRTG